MPELGTNLLAPYGISVAREASMWKAHRREQLLSWAALPLGKKLEMVEEMRELAEMMGRSRERRLAARRMIPASPAG